MIWGALAAAKAPIALLMGNQDYTTAVGPPNNLHNDVEFVGAALRKIGFKVHILKDASYREMDIAIKRHASTLCADARRFPFLMSVAIGLRTILFGNA